jgi:hypothetical protein
LLFLLVGDELFFGEGSAHNCDGLVMEDELARGIEFWLLIFRATSYHYLSP